MLQRSMRKHFKGIAILLATAMIVQTCMPAFAGTADAAASSEIIPFEEEVTVTTPSEGTSSETDEQVIPQKEEEEFLELSEFEDALGVSEHAITAVCNPAGGGTIKFDRAGAATGEHVRFMIFPEEDYRVNKVTFNPALTASKSDLGIYSFVMPDRDVSVTVEFSNGIIIDRLELSSDEEIIEDVDYSYSEKNKTLTILSDAMIEIKNVDPEERVEQKIKIPKGVSANIVLAGVNLRQPDVGESIITIADNNPEDVHIFLKEDTENILLAEHAEVIKKTSREDSGWLIISGEGSLDARTSYWASSVIGASSNAKVVGHSYNILIESGNIYLGTTGEGRTAILGGGYNSEAGNIFITGGCVTFGKGYYTAMGSGYTPYSQRLASGRIVVTDNASIKFETKANPAPTKASGSDAKVYQLQIDNPNGREIKIDGVTFPYTEHVTPRVSDKAVYVSLTAGSINELHQIEVGDDIHFVYYDTNDKEWKEPEGKFQQRISFESNPLKLFVNDFSNPVISKNTIINPNEGSTLIYSSCNPEVADVNETTGEFTLHKSGSAVIRVRSVLAGYADAYASYELICVKKSDIKTVQPEHGELTVNSYAYGGDTVYVTSDPDSGYELGEITVTGDSGTKYEVNLKGNDGTFVMPDENVTVSGVFGIETYAILVNQTDNGWIVAPERALAGTTVSLKAICEAGYILDYIEVEAQDAEPASYSNAKFIMPAADVTVTPHFEVESFAIKTVDPDNGSLTIDRRSAYYEDEISFEALAHFDYRFATVSVITVTGRTIPVYAAPSQDNDMMTVGHFIMPNESVTVTAVFERVKHTIEVLTTDGGKVTANPDSAIYGQKVTLTVKPNSGCYLTYIGTVDGPEVVKTPSKDNEYTFVMPERDVTVTAGFDEGKSGTKKNPWKIGKTNPDYVTAYIGADNTLFIEADTDGDGIMRDYKDYETQWYNLYNSLKHMVVGEGIKRLGDYTLHHFYRLHEFQTVLLPDSLEEIGEYSLSTLHYLKEIEIPANVKKIEAYAFSGDEELKKVVFKGNPDTIGTNAFKGVTADVYIPASWLDYQGQFDPQTHQYGGKLNYIIVSDGESYSINSTSTTHGKFIPEKNFVKAGTTVHVDINADPGWYMESFEITPNVLWTRNDDKISFTMPDCDVTISGTFHQPGTRNEPWLIGKNEGHPEYVKAYFDESTQSLNIITASNNAKMMDFEDGKQPWAKIKDKIKTINTEGTNLHNFGAYAFKDCTELSICILDSDILEIGAHAFEGCSKLTTCHLKDVATVSDFAFRDCIALANLSTSGDGLASTLYIGESAFENAKSIKGIRPVKVNCIGKAAFKGCTGLEHVYSLGDSSAISEIPESAFENCSSMEYFSFSQNLCILGKKAFSGCRKLTTFNFTAAKIQKFDELCFADCKSLQKMDFMGYNAVPEIAADAFKNMNAKVYINKDYLRKASNDNIHINDPNGTYYYGASKLVYVIDSNSSPKSNHVVRIKQSRSGSVSVDGVSVGRGSYVQLDFTSYGYYPKGKIISTTPELDLVREDWTDYVPGYGNREIYHFHMPDEDVEIQIQFSDDEEIIDDNIPEPEEEEEDDGYWYIGAENPKAVKAWIEDGVLHIEGKGDLNTFNLNTLPWFNQRSSIYSVEISEGITSLTTDMFYDMSNVRKLKLPSTLKTIGDDAFWGCWITDLVFPAGLETIGYNAFDECGSLTNVVFLGKPKNIDNHAFRDTNINAYVPRSWLNSGVTVDMLNDPNGNYQYSGTIHYTVEGTKQYTVSTSAGKGGNISVDRFYVPSGTRVYITAKPDEGYKLDSVTLNTGESVDDLYSFVMPESNVMLMATFVKANYSISSSHSTGCNLKPSVTKATIGTHVKLNAKADTGYSITECTVTGVTSKKIIPVSMDEFVMPAENVKISLKAEKTPYKITIKDVTTGVASAKATATYQENVAVKVNPNPHYGFRSLEVTSNGEKVSSSEKSFKMPAGDVVVTPVFERTYTFDLSSTEGGTVTYKGYTGFAGDKVTLSMQVLPGYNFVKWESNDVTVENNSFIMPEKDVTVRAVFEKDETVYRLYVRDGGCGKVSVASASKAKEKITFKVTANPGYEYLGTGVQGVSGTYYPVVNSTFTMPEEDVTLIPEFRKLTYNIRLMISTTSQLYGSAVLCTPSGATASCGDKVTVGVNCNTDCEAEITVDPWAEITDNGDGTISFDMPFADTDIHVDIAPKQGTETYPWKIGKVNADDLLAWLDDAGTLHIEGSGSMKDWNREGAPWFEVKEQINSVYVASPSVGYFGKNAFTDVNADVSVPHSWPNENVTLGDLNDPDGEYQYGGNLAYRKRRGLYSITVAKDISHGRLLSSDAYADGGETIRITDSAETGYHLEGITVRDDGENPVPMNKSTFTMPESNVEVTATFVPNTYKVTYVANGHGTAPAAATCSYGSKLIRPENPQEGGYIFDGWATNSECVGRWNFDSDTMPYEDIVLYACWNPQMHTVKWIGDGEEVLETDTNVPHGTVPVYDGEIPTKDPIGTEGSKTYYHFDGWNPEVTEISTLSETIRYRAKFVGNTITKPAVKFMANGHGQGTIPPIQYATPGEVIAEPQAPTETGYVFGGWYKNASCTEGSEWNFSTDTISKSIILYAKWTIQTFNVHWMNDGEELMTTEVDYGKVPVYTGNTPKRAETRVNTYTFSGWNPEPQAAYSDKTYNAVYDAATKSYVMIFDTDGLDKNPEYQYITVGEKAVRPATPSADGFFFDCWILSGENSRKWNFDEDVMPDRDIVLKAHWIIKTYSVVWKNYDGSVLNNPILGTRYGSVPEYRGSTPKKPMTADYIYTFDHWTPELEPVTGPAEYTAVFSAERRTYTLSFDMQGHGTAPESQEICRGDLITEPQKPYASNYTFTGWYTDKTCSKENEWNFETDTMPASRMTLYAGWEYSGHGGGGGGGGGSRKSDMPAGSVQGIWTYHPESDMWTFASGGQDYKSCWAYIYNPYAKGNQNKADWFRFDSTGRMLTGWWWIKGSDGITRCYYLNPVSDNTLGACFMGPATTPDGYTVDINGAWTVDGIVQTR